VADDDEMTPPISPREGSPPPRGSSLNELLDFLWNVMIETFQREVWIKGDLGQAALAAGQDKVPCPVRDLRL
jgi:hypothetical protein